MFVTVAVRAVDDTSFDAYVAEPAVVAFVRSRDAATGVVRSLLEALATQHGPRVGFAMVDVHACAGLAARFAIDRVPTVILFDDHRIAGRLADPIVGAELARLIEDRLGRPR